MKTKKIFLVLLTTFLAAGVLMPLAAASVSWVDQPEVPYGDDNGFTICYRNGTYDEGGNIEVLEIKPQGPWSDPENTSWYVADCVYQHINSSQAPGLREFVSDLVARPTLRAVILDEMKQDYNGNGISINVKPDQLDESRKMIWELRLKNEKYQIFRIPHRSEVDSDRLGDYQDVYVGLVDASYLSPFGLLGDYDISQPITLDFTLREFASKNIPVMAEDINKIVSEKGYLPRGDLTGILLKKKTDLEAGIWDDESFISDGQRDERRQLSVSFFPDPARMEEGSRHRYTISKGSLLGNIPSDAIIIQFCEYRKVDADTVGWFSSLSAKKYYESGLNFRSKVCADAESFKNSHQELKDMYTVVEDDLYKDTTQSTGFYISKSGMAGNNKQDGEALKMFYN